MNARPLQRFLGDTHHSSKTSEWRDFMLPEPPPWISMPGAFPGLASPGKGPYHNSLIAGYWLGQCWSLVLWVKRDSAWGPGRNKRTAQNCLSLPVAALSFGKMDQLEPGPRNSREGRLAGGQRSNGESRRSAKCHRPFPPGFTLQLPN